MTLVLRDSQGAVYAPSTPNEVIDTGVHNLGTILVPAAVSPNSLQNPSFRQMFYSRETAKLRDYDHYYFSLQDVVDGSYGFGTGNNAGSASKDALRQYHMGAMEALPNGEHTFRRRYGGRPIAFLQYVRVLQLSRGMLWTPRLTYKIKEFAKGWWERTE